RRNSRLAKPWRMKRKSQSPPKNSQAQTRIASAFIRRLLRRLHHNGLLRQYYPKGSSVEAINDRAISQVEEQINDRPRKLLEYACPMDYFSSLTAA
ncbi:MAG: hypothetical protein ACI8T1_002915, partial [Verrucomicrobiales bacterium]